jgi:glycosyltransferase involved in cell wall biosynthesis
MPNPLVTAVVPLHNHAGWVGDCLRSLAAQDYDNLRIVVVDDGSTDNSAETVLALLEDIVQPEQQAEPAVYKGRLRGTGRELMLNVFRQAHGPSFARNWGCRVGFQGTDLFAFLDSDDLYAPTKVSRSVAAWQEHPQHIGVVYSDFDTLHPGGLRLRQFKEPFSRKRLLEECLINCDSLVGAEAFAAVDGFDESLRTCEDYDLWLRLTERYLAVHIPESLVSVRVGAHSSTSTVAKAAWEANYRRVFEKLRQRNGGTR